MSPPPERCSQGWLTTSHWPQAPGLLWANPGPRQCGIGAPPWFIPPQSLSSDPLKSSAPGVTCTRAQVHVISGTEPRASGVQWKAAGTRLELPLNGALREGRLTVSTFTSCLRLGQAPARNPPSLITPASPGLGPPPSSDAHICSLWRNQHRAISLAESFGDNSGVT